METYHELTLSLFLKDPKLIVHLNRISKKKVDELDLEIITVDCDNLSNHSFLDNNDLNVTGACLDVNFVRNELVTLHASPCFWKFAFDKNANRIIQVEKTFDTSGYEATTLVRMAFKAFELGFPFTFGTMDPTIGTIAESQKVKFEKMKDWNDSPFHAYQLKKERSYYRIVKKHEQVKCVKCGTKNANRNCSNKMCKRCCLTHGSVSCRTHKKTIN